MSYTTRGIEWAEELVEGSIPPEGSFEPFNYVDDWDFETTPNVDERVVVGGGRDARKRALAEIESGGRLTTELTSAKFFKYVLGSISSHDLDPYTIGIAGSLPTFTIKRGLATPYNILYYYGCKVDSARLRIEVGEPVVLEINFVARNSSLDTSSSYTAPDLDFDLVPFYFYHLKTMRNSSTLSGVQRLEIEINNNLEAEWDADSTRSQPREASRIREKELRVTGRLVVREGIETLMDLARNNTQFTLTAELATSSKTITITMPNVMFTRIPDTGRGMDVYEVEFPFIAGPKEGLDSIEIVEEGSTWNDARA